MTGNSWEPSAASSVYQARNEPLTAAASIASTTHPELALFPTSQVGLDHNHLPQSARFLMAKAVPLARLPQEDLLATVRPQIGFLPYPFPPAVDRKAPLDADGCASIETSVPGYWHGRLIDSKPGPSVASF